MVQVVILTEQKSSGSSGGGSTGGAWNTRLLNTIVKTPSTTWCSLNSITNEFSMTTGKYLVSIKAVGVGVGSHQVRLRNTTDSTNFYGISSLSYALTPGNSSNAEAEILLDFSGNKTFVLEHFCEKSVPNFGLGFPVGASGNNEVYASVSIQKL